MKPFIASGTIDFSNFNTSDFVPSSGYIMSNKVTLGQWSQDIVSKNGIFYSTDLNDIFHWNMDIQDLFE